MYWFSVLGCLTPQLHAMCISGMDLRRVVTTPHRIEAAGQSSFLIQSHCTNTGPTADAIMLDAYRIVTGVPSLKSLGTTAGPIPVFPVLRAVCLLVA